MAAENKESVCEYRVVVFADGDCDRDLEGRLRTYLGKARDFLVFTREEAMRRAEGLKRQAHKAYDDFWENGEYDGDCAEEWIGGAVYYQDEIIWQWGQVLTDEEIEQSWA
jgi:hypothetical protein